VVEEVGRRTLRKAVGMRKREIFPENTVTGGAVFILRHGLRLPLEPK
jgi:hypothetical protein